MALTACGSMMTGKVLILSACHIDGELFLKMQLKGRLTIDKKYIGKSIYITFNQDKNWYAYPHDELMNKILEMNLMSGSKSWED